ncbi:hypothetical protein CRENBAI_006939, partial [Crenichthys baileyi]
MRGIEGGCITALIRYDRETWREGREEKRRIDGFKMRGARADTGAVVNGWPGSTESGKMEAKVEEEEVW